MGAWRDDNPGKPIVIYILAGFSNDFERFGIYEARINLNAEGNGLEYMAPLYHPDEVQLTGQIHHIFRARSEEEPEISVLRSLRNECLPQLEAAFPDTKPDIIERVAFAVGCVRVQSNFTPDTVGNSVTVMIADRESRRIVMGTL